MLKYKRFMAFITDALLVSLLAIILSNNVRLNRSLYEEEKYIEAYNNKVKTIEVVVNNNPEEMIKEYDNQIGKELYDLIKVQGYRYLIFLVIVFLYYVIFVFFNDGKTVGCAIFKIKIVNGIGEKANLLNLTIRSLFMGTSFVYMVPIVSFVQLIVPRLYNGTIANMTLMFIPSIFAVLEIVFILYFLFSKKNMGLHDYLSNTKIIDISK